MAIRCCWGGIKDMVPCLARALLAAEVHVLKAYSE
jgi:hypothetical protein